MIVDGSAAPPRLTLANEEGLDGAASAPGDCCCVAVVRRRARAAGSCAVSVIGANSRLAGWLDARGETSAERVTASLAGRTAGKVACVGCPAAAATSPGSARATVNCRARDDLAIWPGRSDRGCGDGCVDRVARLRGFCATAPGAGWGEMFVACWLTFSVTVTTSPKT